MFPVGEDDCGCRRAQIASCKSQIARAILRLTSRKTTPIPKVWKPGLIAVPPGKTIRRQTTLSFMKIQTISAVMAVTILLAGCGKQNTPSGTASSTTNGQTSVPAVAAAPVAQAAMSAWQQGDKAAAVSSFLAADWSSRPLFASNSLLSLTEDQFKALSEADRQTRSGEIRQLDSMKQLAAAVAQAGRDAATKGDTAQAQKCFTALKQCGAALSSPDSLSLVQLVGKALNKMADTELAKIGK